MEQQQAGRGQSDRWTVLTFNDIKLLGNDIQIESAELRLRFNEEGRSHISQANIELHDGAEKDGEALSVAEYRKQELTEISETRHASWSVPASLVSRWLDDPATNKGLTFKVVPLQERIFEFIFSMQNNLTPERRPVLIVRYSFAGEVAPFAPEIETNVAGKIFGPVFPVRWRQKTWDLNGTPVSYEVAVAPTGGEFSTVGRASADAISLDVNTATLDTQEVYQVRLRANTEVVDWNAPGPDVYRDEMAKGKTVINCITVNSNTPTSPNIFIHHRGINTRIWPWVTYALGQQGIEFWRVNPAPSVLTPGKYGGVWGDGSLFYRGLPAELGIGEEIALPSIRLKILRDGIEDFELLSMLKRKNSALAKRFCHMMTQETKDYDGSFSKPVQHVSHNWNTDGKGDRMQNGYIIWESDPERLAETRAAIAAALSGLE